MSKPTLILQPGKTYVTKGGDEVTMELNSNHNGSYPFIGDNKCTYTESGCIFAWGESNDLDISHELIQDTEDENWHDSPCDICDSVTHRNGNSSDNTIENLTFVTPEENRQPKLIDVLKFKQKSNGIKRKLTLKDYSDDSVEIIFRTKFSKDEPQVTTGIRLSYDAVLMLFDSLEYMLEEQNVEQGSTLNQHNLH
jgi:hypothetical protein